MLSSGIVRVSREFYIEGPARGDDPQVFVEDNQRFSNGVHHCLGERTGVFDLAELASEHRRPFPRWTRFKENAGHLTEMQINSPNRP
jgi:cytochrome P450